MHGTQVTTKLMLRTVMVRTCITNESETAQNNVAYEILKMKFIANILCRAGPLWVLL